MFICHNVPQSGDLGAGFLLYKGHMIQMLVITDTSDDCYDVYIDFQTHCVLNRSAFLFKSNYVMHNLSGRQIRFDLDMELQISWENAMSDCKIILCI